MAKAKQQTTKAKKESKSWAFTVSIPGYGKVYSGDKVTPKALKALEEAGGTQQTYCK